MIGHRTSGFDYNPKSFSKCWARGTKWWRSHGSKPQQLARITLTRGTHRECRSGSIQKLRRMSIFHGHSAIKNHSPADCQPTSVLRTSLERAVSEGRCTSIKSNPKNQVYSSRPSCKSRLSSLNNRSKTWERLSYKLSTSLLPRERRSRNTTRSS